MSESGTPEPEGLSLETEAAPSGTKVVDAEISSDMLVSGSVTVHGSHVIEEERAESAGVSADEQQT